MSKFDTSIFGIMIFLLELNMKANVRLGSHNDLEKAALCYQGDYTSFEDEAIRADWSHPDNMFMNDVFLDNSDE